ncbi:hypothetical protein [Synechococcus phage S-B68]|nr:hypothetical protein [Synechococcus phage S-B68]
MTGFPFGVVFLMLVPGLLFTAWTIYYVLKLAHDEMKEEV